jgi:HPt (histidine-containing phosphotransfer) domain-containing protein
MLDRQVALGRLGNDHELYEEICRLFKRDAADMLGKLREAIVSGETSVATRHAHSLKSVSASIGAMVFSDIARTAEFFGRDGNIIGMSDLLSELERNLNEVILEL